MMEFEEISKLIAKFIMGTLDCDEQKCLQKWIEQDKGNQQLFEKLTNPQFIRGKISQWESMELPEPPRMEMKNEASTRHKSRTSHFRYAAAAVFAVLLLVSGGLYLFRLDRKYQALKKEYTKEHYLASIKPGATKATLTTQSGQTIVLGNDEGSNTRALEAVKKTQGGNDGRNRKKEADRQALNNLEIPRGGEFHITLEDGTEVWLNAESSLKYPDHFEGDTREALLTGEAYFKVAKDAQGRPFVVKTAGQCVRVYGTEFNIFSYEEDKFVYTTLVNGCIALTRDNSQDSELILTPGHQAVFEKVDGETKVKPVATEVVTSWRNGMFVFEDQTLDQIMRQLSRWYNFTYSFTTEEAANTLFMGRMARSSKFGEVLEILEHSGHLKFDVKDSHIVISKDSNQ